MISSQHIEKKIGRIKVKKILFIVNYLILDEEGGNSRFMYLAKKLLAEGNVEIEIVTSNFLHAKKVFRLENEKNIFIDNKAIKITFLSELGYKKNVSLKRTLSNKVFAKSVSKYLKSMKKNENLPDVIYFSVPSLEYGNKVVNFARKNEINTIADVQDIWPDAFEMVSPFPKIVNDILFFNSKRLSRNIYSKATRTIAVSNTYAEIIDKYRKNNVKTDVIYLGSDFKDFDKYFNKKNSKENIIRFTYVGTLGHSYDLSQVFEAFKQIKDLKIEFEFHVFGDGPLRKTFEDKVVKLCLTDVVSFHGRLPYNDLVGELGEMDVAINPIRDGAAQSIINKVGDYAAASLPVINTQENIEYRTLVKDYQIGINTINDSNEIAKSLKEIISHRELISKWGSNNRRLGNELFDRRQTYKYLCGIVLNTIS